MNKLDKDYQDLVRDILENGVEKTDRTGTGTKSVFGRTIRHNMSDGFPLLTTKKMAFKPIWTELVWFLQGNTNIQWLINNGNYIWVGDVYKNYVKKCKVNDSSMNEWMRQNDDGSFSLYTKEQFIEKIKTDDEFANKWGELGPIYGAQWRRAEYIDKENFINSDNLKEPELHRGLFYKIKEIDQIKNLINNLNTNPDSRRIMVSSWNVGQIDEAVLPPCHYNFQVYTKDLTYKERYNIWFKNNYETGLEFNYEIKPDFDNKYYERTPTKSISLMFTMRSSDVGLGLPFNIASYGLLLIMLGQEVGMEPDELVGVLGDTHIYLDHIEGLTEQISREPLPLPRIRIQDGIESCGGGDFLLTDYQSHSKIVLPLSN